MNNVKENRHRNLEGVEWSVDNAVLKRGVKTSPCGVEFMDA